MLIDFGRQEVDVLVCREIGPPHRGLRKSSTLDTSSLRPTLPGGVFGTPRGPGRGSPEGLLQAGVDGASRGDSRRTGSRPTQRKIS